MNWDCNPKQRFTRNHLEKCYNLRDTSTTYRGLGVGRRETFVGHKDVIEKPMGHKRRPHSTPYWNFWRAVFAGWLIRYPGKIFKGIGMFFLFIVFLIVFSSSPEVENTPSMEYNDNVPSVSE